MSFLSIKKFVVLVGLVGLIFALPPIFSPKEAEAACVIAGSYGPVSWTLVTLDTYSYSRTNENVTIGISGGASYTITDPGLTILYSATFGDCSTSPCGLLTFLKENATGEYYVLVNEDDFMPGGVVGYVSNVVQTAYETDFIPIVSQNLIGGTISYSAVARIGGLTGYSIITAQNTPVDGSKKINFIFADYIHSGFLNGKGWAYNLHAFGLAGSFNAAIDICAITSVCANLSCEAANTTLPCECGSATAAAANPWCCAGNNAVYSTQALCQQVGACAVAPSPSACGYGGLIPCGRNCDDPGTLWKDDAPCTLCHLILMVQKIIEFLIKLSAVMAVFVIALGGLMHIFSAGDESNISKSKTVIRYGFLGLATIFIAWAVVAAILTMMGYIDPLNGEWYIMNCDIP